MRASGRLGAIAAVKHNLTEKALPLNTAQLSPSFFGAAHQSAELSLRQYLLVHLGGLNFNSALLVSESEPHRKVAFALPYEWRQIVAKHGFKVDHLRCALLWHSYAAGILGYGIWRCLKILIESIRSHWVKPGKIEPYAYFVGLSSNNLPQPQNTRPSHDIVSWYLQWPGRDPSIRSVRHGITGTVEFDIQNVAVRAQKNPLPSLIGIREVLGFLHWAVGATLLASSDLLRGRWWHAVLLGEAAMSAQARSITSSFTARAYLFHNSSWIYRPLWTYEAEHQGAEVTLYFYSTNCEPFKRNNGYPAPYYGYKAMNWPQYWVWDDYQADFIHRVAIGNPQTLVVGPIWFSGTADQLPGSERAVAVFDVTPLRASRYCSLGLDVEFYTPTTANKFLKDISEAILKQNGQLLWKRKRNGGNAAHPQYRYFAEQLEKESHVSLISPDISAIKVIEASAVAISMPFTSTAIIARELGKPSVYYDPTGKLQIDDRAAHGIPVLCNPKSLEEWLAAHLGTHQSG